MKMVYVLKDIIVNASQIIKTEIISAHLTEDGAIRAFEEQKKKHQIDFDFDVSEVLGSSSAAYGKHHWQIDKIALEE